jgi:hypothetical protein
MTRVIFGHLMAVLSYQGMGNGVVDAYREDHGDISQPHKGYGKAYTGTC